MNSQGQRKQLVVSDRHHRALAEYCNQPHIRRSIKDQTEMLIERFLESENFPISEVTESAQEATDG